MKAEDVYEIFNNIQTGSNTVDNLSKLINYFEKDKNKGNFINHLENVFLIILKNCDKSNMAIKNIGEFISDFLIKILKDYKLRDNTKILINHFCLFFTQNSKKIKMKNLCLYLLNIFLEPYSEGNEVLYEEKTLNQIKEYIISILKGKHINNQLAVIKLLQKNKALKHQKDIWERLELLLNNSNQILKKEILKLFENDSEILLKYLLEMFDDESAEIRSFVFDKLSEIKNFDLIDSQTKVKLFFIGLSDSKQKVNNSAKTLLKNFLSSLGVFRLKNENIMEVDTLNDKEDIIESSRDKIEKSTSPIRIKKKLADSPSRIFDKLDVLTYYNHPKYSVTFQLITEAIIEITDPENLKDFVKNIIENLTFASNIYSDKKRKSFNRLSSTYDLNAIFNDVFFLQNCLKFLNYNKNEKNYSALRNTIFDIIPDMKTLSMILEYFYKHERNIMILHQLFLIANYLNYDDEIGNREIVNILKPFVLDLDLDKYSINGMLLRKIDFNNNFIEYDEDNNESRLLMNNLENNYLPFSRRIIFSMEDLVDHALKILFKIYYNVTKEFYLFIMEIVYELKELYESNNIQDSINKLISEIKDKVTEIQALDLKKHKDKNRIAIDNEIIKKQKDLDMLDDNLINLTKEEKTIINRILKLCEFILMNTKLPVNLFTGMINDFIFPALQKKEYPEVMRMGYTSMGVLAINHFSDYKNFLKLFFEHIEKPEIGTFHEFDRIALTVIFDSILQNNIEEYLSNEINTGTISDKLEFIIRKYLYHPHYVARLIVITGLSKLLIANRIAKPEFALSRIIVLLSKSYEIRDSTSEEFHIKVHEIITIFLYFYLNIDKSHTKAIINSVLIILTSQFFSNNLLLTYEKNTVLNNFVDTSLGFIINIIKMISENTDNNFKMKKTFYKIIKFSYYCLEYFEKGNFKSKLTNLKNLVNNIKKFFEKSRIDIFMLNDISEEMTLKLFPYIYTLKKFDTNISDNFEKYLEKLESQDLIIGESKIDLKEKFCEMSEIIRNKEDKYFKKIDEFYTFLESLKKIKYSVINETNESINDDSIADSIMKLKVEINDEENDEDDKETGSFKKREISEEKKAIKRNIRDEKKLTKKNK